MTDTVDNDPLREIYRETDQALATITPHITWANDEIDQAIARHPAHRDTLHHSFLLLRPSPLLVATEFVYRSHCREILNRVATDADTRPGTAAEVCCLCREISLIAPLRTAAAGLYLRMWATAFPSKPVDPDRSPHYEALRGSTIDNLEALARRTLAIPERTLGPITCTGRHDGEPVDCTYAQA